MLAWSGKQVRGRCRGVVQVRPEVVARQPGERLDLLGRRTVPRPSSYPSNFPCDASAIPLSSLDAVPPSSSSAPNPRPLPSLRPRLHVLQGRLCALDGTSGPTEGEEEAVTSAPILSLYPTSHLLSSRRFFFVPSLSSFYKCICAPSPSSLIHSSFSPSSHYSH